MKTYPLTRNQMGIFLAGQNAQGNENYNCTNIGRLGSDVEIPKLKLALSKVFDNHSAFKARITTNDEGMPCFVYNTEETVVIQELEMHNIEELKQRAMDFPFDLSGGPLYQMWIVHTVEDNAYWFVYIIHHLIFDGVSNTIFTNDLKQAYHGNDLMPEAKTFMDICLGEVEMRKSEAYTTAKTYYSSTFADAIDVVTYPSEDVTTPVVPADEQWEEIEVPLAVDRKIIKSLCRKYNVSTDMIFYTAFGYVMSKLSNEDKAVFSSIHTGRNTEEVRNTMAMMVQTYPLFIDFSDKASVSETLGRLEKQAKTTRQHTIYSFGEVTSELGVKPLMSIAYHGTLHDFDWVINEEPVQHFVPLKHAPGFNLSFAIVQVGNDYHIRVFHNKNLHTVANIRKICLYIDNVLSQMAEGKEFADMQLLNEEQTAQVMALSKGLPMEYDASKTPLELIMEFAKSTPDAIAVADIDTSLSYAQLDTMTNALAHVLVANGVQQNQFVGLMMDRSVRFPIAALAIHKAGAAYMPLDVDYPNERLSYMIENSEATVLVTTHAVLEAKQAEGGLNTDGLHIIYIEEIDLDAQSEPICLTTPDSLAYMIYTSGSTGKPKGAMLHQKGLLNFTLSIADTEQLTASDRIASHRSFSFDAHIGDLYPILAKGGSLHIMPSKIRKDLDAMYQFIVDNKITGFGCTTSLMMLMLNNYDMPVRFVTAGGEKLSGVESDHIRIINLYGPTECTNDSTLYVIEPGQKVQNIPIGRPLHNVTCLVMSKDGKLLPPGTPGELCIAGVQVGKGYWRLPEKTAEAFVDSPLVEDGKLYRTGDLVRWNADNQLEYLGRIDGQVKLRGFRIEMGEIESTALQVTGIKQVAAAVKEVGGNRKLVLYYTLNDGATVSDLDVSAHIEASTLADYMHPEIYQHLDHMPQLPNGKIDRKHLPEPVVEMQEEESETSRVLNILEQKLVQLVGSLLGVESINLSTSLRKYGMSSLVSMKLAAQLFKQFGIKMKGKELASGCIMDIENLILNKVFDATEEVSASSTVETATVKNVGTLSYPQQGVYLDIMRNPDSIQYNIPMCIEFPSDYTADAIADALKKVIVNHPILSARILSEGEEAVQVIPENIVPQVTISNENIETLKEGFVRPFDLGQGPLYRAVVSGSTLLLDILHLVCDGGSNGIMMAELCRVLAGESLTPERYTYLDYVIDEKKSREGKEFAACKAFFAERMKTIDEASSIQADVNKGEDYKGHLCYASTPVNKLAVTSFAQKLNITPAALLLAAANYTIARYTNSNDVCIATISNGRSNVLVSDTVGMFVNTLALTAHLKDQTVEQFILDTAKEYELSLEHENYPFAELSAEYDFHPDVFYQYQIGVGGNMMVGGKRVMRTPIGETDPKFKMIISIEEDAEGQMRIEMQYNDAFYSHDLAQGLSLSMANVLQNMMADTSVSIRKVSMLNAEQKAQIETFHDGPKADVPIKLYHKLLEASVDAHADDLALVAVDQQLTYAEMNAQMNRIAYSLIARGIKRGDRIALLLPRTSRLILSQYGVLKAGGAYIPCDPKYPTDRINHILDDSAAPLIITTADRLEEFSGRSVDVEELLNNPDIPENLENPDVYVEPDDLAYLIYTSGSTGVPKGVQLMHKGVCNYHCKENLIQGMLNSECHAALGITTISFDMSVWETGSPLMLGKTLVLASDDQCNDPLALAALIERYDIGCMTATTSRFMQLLESEEFEHAFQAHIRMAYQGGEGLSKALLTKLHGYGVRIVNGYGPTETIANSHASELSTCDIPHIGKPCCNYNNYIVDNDGNELPVGVVGELLIGGASVAKGYNNLPEQTEARFKVNPYKNDGSRIYHSGDYARWLPDGNVMVLGRKDNQVKLRGLRIELGEVESAMTKVEGIKNTVVMIKKLQGRDHLCAYFVADRKIEIDALKAELKKTLTHYMIPTAYLQMDAFPLTPNGKTNIKVLPDPEVAVSQTEQVAASNKTEQDFCDIFAEVLGLEKVGATDNFFEIGGTSLVAMRVVLKAVKLGYSIVYKDVFENPSPREMATLLGIISEPVVPAADSAGTVSKPNAMAPVGTPDDKEIHDYDYTKIDQLLQKNTISHFTGSDWKQNLRALGTCIVTGATGYLGIHVVKELIERDDVSAIYCMVRSNKRQTAESRLRTQLFYYFSDTYAGLFGTRLFILEGDVTNDSWHDKIPALEGNITVFNCAANVKHFSAGTDIEDINIGGCQSCIEYCLKTGARLIQTSTHSIEGRMISTADVEVKTLSESTLYLGQSQSGQYTRSKFIAERNVLEAIAEKGLDAKIMRYGNLAARSTDGEFQINFSSNGFMNRLNIYKTLEVIPYALSGQSIEFSPINEVAHSSVLLATLPSEFSVFMPINDHHEPMGDVILCMRNLGFPIQEVEQDEFDAIVLKAGQDPAKAAILQSLLAYTSNIRGKKVAYNTRNYDFTTQVLLRMGFHWNYTSWDYMERIITAIDGLGFFDDDYER